MRPLYGILILSRSSIFFRRIWYLRRSVFCISHLRTTTQPLVVPYSKKDTSRQSLKILSRNSNWAKKRQYRFNGRVCTKRKTCSRNSVETKMARPCYEKTCKSYAERVIGLSFFRFAFKPVKGFVLICFRVTRNFATRQIYY